MTGINKVDDPGYTKYLINEHFNFEVPPNIPVLVHRLIIDGKVVGYVATESYNGVGGPHIYMVPKHRNRETLAKVTQIFHDIYCPAMKELGMHWLVTNCDQADTHTSRFLGKLGFDLKEVVIAQLPLR